MCIRDRYLVEIASKRVRRLISPAVDLLAGIPSIIYGFFGMIIIRPFIAQLTGGLGFGALTAWLDRKSTRLNSSH